MQSCALRAIRGGSCSALERLDLGSNELGSLPDVVCCEVHVC